MRAVEVVNLDDRRFRRRAVFLRAQFVVVLAVPWAVFIMLMPAPAVIVMMLMLVIAPAVIVMMIMLMIAPTVIVMMLMLMIAVIVMLMLVIAVIVVMFMLMIVVVFMLVIVMFFVPFIGCFLFTHTDQLHSITQLSKYSTNIVNFLPAVESRRGSGLFALNYMFKTDVYDRFDVRIGERVVNGLRFAAKFHEIRHAQRL